MNTKTIERINTRPVETETRPELFAETVLRRVNALTDEALYRVITEDKNILASDDRLFRHTFGRDTTISAERLLERDGELTLQAARLLASYQGVTVDRKSEEEPGKILHELKIPNEDDPEQQELYDRLGAAMGIGDREKFLSYTSIDATLEFIHMIARYVERYDDDILRTTVERQGETVSIEESVRDAVEWLRRNIQSSDIGLVGAHRTNPNGVIVPDLLDGGTSFMHADGKTLVNYESEVNTLNFQSLGYQALRDGASILTDRVVGEEERAKWTAEANELQRRTIEYFWMPEQRRVAMAMDRDDKGAPRRVETNTILPAVALRTGIFDKHPDIVEAIFEGLYAPEMMTCVGPRTQSLETDAGYTRYQEPPWPVLVGRVVEGAMRYGADDIATDLIERMLMGIYVTGQEEEFHQVTRDGELGIYAEQPSAESIRIVATNKPEAPQAWTAATMWWLTHVALPQLAKRHNYLSPQRSSGIDLSLNKQVTTVAYIADIKKAQEIERAIIQAAESGTNA